MEKGIVKIASFGISTVVIVLFLSFFLSSTVKNDTVNKINESKIIVDSTETTDQYQTKIKENYKVYSVPMPKGLNFSGEKVPMWNVDVRERLDRELLVNTYWHSNSFLFHKRANRWFPTIEKILKENGIPDDFKYVALIESGLDNVVSPAGAAGFWQFMKATGKGYGLEINEFVDERYHVEKSTKAACKYLNDAYKKFGNWTLAAASYNMGKGGLNKQLTKQQINSYYQLELNKETSRYVYRILAAKCILENPENYGFNIRKQDLYNPYKAYNVQIDSTISNLAEFAIQKNMDYKTLRLLNPWLKEMTLPNNSKKKYELTIPSKNSGLLISDSTMNY